jgi:ElaB/YqjD/DUF883 family membrane-anchored ribosome-binding protein
MNLSSTKLHSSAAADEASGMTDRALGATKELASQAVDRMRDVRSGMKDLPSGMKDFANRSASRMSDASVAAQRQLGQYARATGRYVSDEPLKSALIAAAIGAAVTALILAMRRNNRYYY